MSRKKKSNPYHSTRPKGKLLDAVTIESIIQTYALTGNYSETARRHNTTVGTVRRHIKAAIEDSDPEVRDVRSRTLQRTASRFVGKANDALDAITPEKLEKAALSQVAVTAGIMADKAKMLSEFTQKMDVDHDTRRLPMPDTVEAVEAEILRHVKSIKGFQINFQDAVPDLARETEDTLQEVARVKAALEVDDLDGNPEA